MNGKPWTASDDALLRSLYAERSAAEIAGMMGRSERAIYARAHNIGLAKSPDWIAERQARIMARLDHAGRQHQFKPGTEPWNKGRQFHAGGRSTDTQFRPGTRHGRALALWHPVGSLRINSEGYLERKINDDLPMHKRWRAEHLVVWEAAHGPLPAGHAVAFKDGNKEHVTIDNLELVSRAELMRRNTFHRYGKEIAAAVQLKGAITRQINRRNRNANDQ